MSEKYVVDGYSFKTQEEAAIAVNEIEGIEYLRKRTNFKNPQSVLSVYDKIIDKELFKTPIGYGFLRELQQILYNASDIEPDSIRNIPVAAADEKKSRKSKDKKNKKLYLMPEEQEKKYKNKITNLIILNVFIVIALILVIIITNNSENTNILNYRERLEREYNEKEDELAAWDSQLREKEHQLNEREKEIMPES
ncbi:MAG: hypothetical protein K1W00_03795 [Lachnospiraceae bacterium]